MSPEAQRISIAEACGWKWWTGQWGNNPTPEFRFLSPTGAYNDGYLWGNSAEPEDMALPVMHGPDLPDYLNDLNAMHEAEKMLPESKRPTYVMLLLGDVPEETLDLDIAESEWLLATRTARQRAEAFLEVKGRL